MKKIILFLAVSGLVCQQAAAQNNPVRIGIEGGPSSVKITGGNSGDYGWHSTFSAGFTAQYQINRLLSVKTGIMFDRKGDSYSSEGHDSAGGASSTIVVYAEDNLDYLVVPAMLKVTVGNKIRFFANGGPYFGYLLQARHTSRQYVDQGTDLSVNWNESNYFKRTDLGFSLGAGLGIPVTNNFGVDLELRYNRSLTNIDDYRVATPPPGSQTSLHNVAFNMLVGLSYRLGS